VGSLAKIALDLFLIALSLCCAFFVRFDQGLPPDQRLRLLGSLPFIVSLRFCTLALLSRYQPAWRYVSLHDAGLLLASSLLSSLLIFVAFLALGSPGFSRGVLVIDTLLNVFFLLGIRLLFRLSYPSYSRQLSSSSSADSSSADLAPQPRRVLIIGAGAAGEQVARAVQRQAYQGWRLVGFVDDAPELRGARIHGRPVFGPLSSLPELFETHEIHEALVALPQLSGDDLSRILRLCEKSPARLSLVPEIDELLSGTFSLQQAREIKVEDLLEREPIRLETTRIREFLTGQRVLVTGAGGSIGSEICRQVAQMEPEAIIMVGRGENSIFEAVGEMKYVSPVAPIPVIASIQDPVRMRTIFETYRPTVVFHAAAHKHVPLMEAYPTEAIQNNVFGTRLVANLAEEWGVGKFVLISTDKAVNPKSIMGASKRMAEMIIQSKAAGGSRTEFVAVRFGNVLGSRGSVVPTMQRQIRSGGPVYITHPEMTRYFMTIPEAVQLVLQAGAMGETGQVFVLDMGKPVRIMDLARNLIRLSGKAPGKDIEIQIIGPRPGEKLHEELLTAEEGIAVTRHSRIFVIQGQVGKLSRAELTQILGDLEEAVRRSDDEQIRRLLKQAIPTMQIA
jgi:FlaA1/EpsC-like NDP-sugar epimerase